MPFDLLILLFLQPLFCDLVGKLVDTFHDSIKQNVEVHGQSLLVVNSECFRVYLPELSAFHLQ
jgi:hypothetical protein